MLMDEEARIVDECISQPIEIEEKSLESEQQKLNRTGGGYFNKYIQLKKYLYKKDAKFIELQQDHLKSIKMLYSMLTPEQKQKLIRINNI